MSKYQFLWNNPRYQMDTCNLSHYKRQKCSIKNINAQKLEDYVVKRLQELSADSGKFQALVNDVNLDLEGQKEPMRTELTEINAQIRDLKSQLDNLVEMAGREGPDYVTELFTKRIEKLTKQIKVGGPVDICVA